MTQLGRRAGAFKSDLRHRYNFNARGRRTYKSTKASGVQKYKFILAQILSNFKVAESTKKLAMWFSGNHVRKFQLIKPG
jgi:hypothetical protein